MLKPVPAAPGGASRLRSALAVGKHGSTPLGTGVGRGLKGGDGTATSGWPCTSVATFRCLFRLSYQATAARVAVLVHGERSGSIHRRSR